jgi:nucleoside-diphosphate-sugar epimerase
MTTESICVVTGGAGFIGCALSAGLVKRFDHVLVLDKLHPQIHARPATTLSQVCDLWRGHLCGASARMA